MENVQPFKTIAYRPEHLDTADCLHRSKQFLELMDGRRTVRHFSSEPVPQEVIDNLIRTASTAPSGAHKQPWTFCVVTNPALKHQIREAAEEEERENYNGRMPKEWLEDLAPLGTDADKEFLDIAPCLIVVFKHAHDLKPDGSRRKNYYVEESVGIACGFLLAAIRNAGLAALTHTPSPMNFLAKLLQRPENERAFLLIPVGFPAENCEVPDLRRKALGDVMVRYA